MTQQADIPKAYGKVVSPTREQVEYRIHVTCPYCGKKHIHGVGEMADRFGFRRAHCGAGKNYELVRSEGGRPARKFS